MTKRNKPPISCHLLLLLTFFVGSLYAQAPESEVAITVSLDHPLWQYHTSQNALFSISVQRNGKPVKDATIHLQVGQEKMPATINKDTLLKKGNLQINGGTLLQPGFLRCLVTAEIEGKKYKALATAAYAPDSIKATAEMPADFTAFWAGAIANARKIPLDSHMTLLPERSTGSINVYEVSFQNDRPGSRIYGILCVPKKQGSYPVELKVPGAGVRAYRGDTALAEKGVITFEIGIHGVPVTMPNEVYYNLAFGPLNEYFFANLNNRDRYYYKRVYVGCVKAIDYLLTLPQTDSSRIAVYGGSQGGALSIVTASLDKRIKYVACLYPALSDVTGYLHGRAGGWPHMFSPSVQPTLQTPQNIQVSSYYDVVNFAKRLTIPGLYAWGYNDETCPPTSMYAAFNNIASPKELFITKETGHWLAPAQAAKVNEWLLQKLQVAQQ